MVSRMQSATILGPSGDRLHGKQRLPRLQRGLRVVFEDRRQ